jgi:DNA mismatch repair protein MutH
LFLTAPISENELSARAKTIAGARLGDIALATDQLLPKNLLRHKGFVGRLIEIYLGATAGTRPEPDFVEIGVELKTLPINSNSKPAESTHVCSISLSNLAGSSWQTSLVCRKLKRVLWVPFEADKDVLLPDRRVGTPFFWTPSHSDIIVLKRDWEEHMELMSTGNLRLLSSHQGQYLQVRPKAANGKTLAPSVNYHGNPSKNLPRGFYLRPTFTAKILASVFE